VENICESSGSNAFTGSGTIEMHKISMFYSHRSVALTFEPIWSCKCHQCRVDL